MNIAEILLDKKAVHLRPNEPFTWTSGIKSPIYCDNRKLMSFPEAREIIINQFVKKIKNDFPNTQVIAGTATAGIAWASWIAQYLDLPLIYVRSSSKGHGLQNLVEGVLNKNQKVVLIEDLISTGKSSIAAAKALQEAGADLLTTIAIFSYEFPFAHESFKSENLKYSTLSSLTALLEVALEKKILTAKQVSEVKEWKKSVTP